jgi:hypothetical protein
MRRQERASTPKCHRQQGTLLAQVLLFGVMVQVVLAVIMLQSIPQHSLILEEANATIGPLIQSTSQVEPGISIHHPMAGLIRSYPNSDHHDPTQRRHSITFTTMPDEIPTLQISVRAILDFMTADPENTFDAMHLCIPERPMRSQDTYPSTLELQKIFTDPRIIIHRLADYGPMTRYLGPLAYEQHPESAIVLFDIDSNDLTYDLNTEDGKTNGRNHTRDIIHLIHASRHLDESAVWCNQGENFIMNEFQQVKPDWDLFPSIPVDVEGIKSYGYSSWNHVHFCRGVGGLLFKPKHFVDFWYNQSEYHESCFWDDDRWVSYQMERQGFPLKVIHVPIKTPTPPIEFDSVMANFSSRTDVDTSTANISNEKSSHRRLGSLTEVNQFLQSDQTCPVAWLTKHPDTYPTARVKSGTPWGRKQAPMTIAELLNATFGLLGPNSSRELHDLERAHRYQGSHERAEQKQKLGATTSKTMTSGRSGLFGFTYSSTNGSRDVKGS